MAPLRIPVPTGVLPAAELKERAISWLRSDSLWVRPRDDNDDDRPLNLHCFKMPREDDDEEPAPFVMASLIPGGRFIAITYIDGRVDLKEITLTEGEWQLRDVARYRLDDPEQRRAVGSSQLVSRRRTLGTHSSRT